MSKVAIAQNDLILNSITQALDALNLEDIFKDKVIAIKPNDTTASSSDKTAVTQPESLKAVIQYVKKCNPKHIVVTGGSGAGETDQIFQISGLMNVINEEGVEFFDHNRPPFVSVNLEYLPEKQVEGPQKSVMVNSRVLEYETLISLAQLKVHQTATVTLSLKNIAMSFPAADFYGHPRGSEKQEHHFFDDMQSFIAAMAKRFPISLSIIVGFPAMIGVGPIGGYTFNSGLVIASRDPLSADTIGAKMLGFDSQAVNHIWEASKLGVGEIDEEKMEFPLLSAKDAFEIFTEKAYGKKLSL